MGAPQIERTLLSGIGRSVVNAGNGDRFGRRLRHRTATDARVLFTVRGQTIRCCSCSWPSTSGCCCEPSRPIAGETGPRLPSWQSYARTRTIISSSSSRRASRSSGCGIATGGSAGFAAYAAIGIAMLPLALLIQDDLGFQKSLPTALAQPRHARLYLLFTIQRLHAGPIHFRAANDDGHRGNSPHRAWLVAVGVVLLVLGFEGWQRFRNEPSMRIIAILGVLPVLILGALSLVGGLNYDVTSSRGL